MLLYFGFSCGGRAKSLFSNPERGKTDTANISDAAIASRVVERKIGKDLENGKV